MHTVAPALHKTLLQQVPRVDRINPIVQMRRGFIEAVQELLKSNPKGWQVENPEMSAFVVVHLIDALTQAAILERPAYLESKVYADEITKIVVRYLCDGTDVSARPKA
jgi:hypothetical protein